MLGVASILSFLVSGNFASHNIKVGPWHHLKPLVLIGTFLQLSFVFIVSHSLLTDLHYCSVEWQKPSSACNEKGVAAMLAHSFGLAAFCSEH